MSNGRAAGEDRPPHTVIVNVGKGLTPARYCRFSDTISNAMNARNGRCTDGPTHARRCTQRAIAAVPREPCGA